MANFGDERAPLEMTKVSSKQVVRICPYCKAANEFGKHWAAGNCRGCGKFITSDNTEIVESALNVHKNPEGKNIIDKEITAFRGEMDERAHIWAEEQAKFKKTGQRTHGRMSEISKRQFRDARKRRKN